MKLAFGVPGIDDAAAAIASCGGSVTPNSWTFAGRRRRDAVDPEGNVIQLLEPLTPAP